MGVLKWSVPLLPWHCTQWTLTNWYVWFECNRSVPPFFQLQPSPPLSLWAWPLSLAPKIKCNLNSSPKKTLQQFAAFWVRRGTAYSFSFPIWRPQSVFVPFEFEFDLARVFLCVCVRVRVCVLYGCLLVSCARWAKTEQTKNILWACYCRRRSRLLCSP